MIPILIVDDAEQDLLLIERVLRQCKILNPTYQLRSGQDCVDFFKHKAVGHGIPPNSPRRALVFLDLVMAPVSGTQVLKAIQSNRDAKESIIIMVSGLTDIKAIHEGYQLGAKTFLVKPVGITDLMQLLDSLADTIAVEESPDGYVLRWRNGKDHTRKSDSTESLTIPA